MTCNKGHSHNTNRSNHSPQRKCPPAVWKYVLFLSVEKSNQITDGQVTCKEMNNVRVGISSNINFSNSRGPRLRRGHRDEGAVLPGGWQGRSWTFQWSSWVFGKTPTSSPASAIGPVCVEVRIKGEPPLVRPSPIRRLSPERASAAKAFHLLFVIAEQKTMQFVPTIVQKWYFAIGTTWTWLSGSDFGGPKTQERHLSPHLPGLLTLGLCHQGCDPEVSSGTR